jgi:hypothetical protein
METKKNALKLAVGSVYFGITGQAYAAGGTISISPSTGSWNAGSEFNVNVLIDGGGSAFNAAQATLNVSPSLTIENVTLGNCDFALVTAPTISNPSFVGAILGGSSSSCTAYTLKLKAVGSGNSNILISGASIKSLKGAHELLGGVGNASYIISGSQGSFIAGSTPTPTQAPEVNSSGQTIYNLTYSIAIPGESTTSGILITLDPTLSTKVSATPNVNESIFTAQFPKVSQGVHTIVTYKNNKEVASQVVNVAGSNRYIAVGNGVSTPSFSWLIYAAFLIPVILGATLVYLGFKYYKKNSASTPPNPPIKE